MSRFVLCFLMGALVISLVGTGCAMNFRPASLVPRERLVGIRVSIPGAPERAAPLPGETFEALPILVSPDDASPVTTAWLACPQLPSRTGIASCGGEPLGFGAPVLGTAPPMQVTVPVDLVARGATAILFAIATCDRGALPRLPDDVSASILPTCEGGDPEARAELSLMSVPVAFDPATANRHPNLGDETITLTDPAGVERPWEPTTEALPADCALAPDAPTLPHLTLPTPPAMGEIDEALLDWTFSITSSNDDRERYQQILPGGVPAAEAREVIQISHYLTAGTFGRQFSAIEGLEDVTEPSTIVWTLPDAEDVPATGLLVHVWWVARDLRGGMAVTERALCVTPP